MNQQQEFPGGLILKGLALSLLWLGSLLGHCCGSLAWERMHATGRPLPQTNKQTNRKNFLKSGRVRKKW